ncbi:hypothetical protein Pmar_PMAR003942 [Perkinsus marinus ATCC 50983]|uniref:Uncharacterized protein n=1 Tax=Perkinsus marinus (strain ATCC 50983 / TXsc) TaxID=423536 RepID=C5L861_PERM5|nr:hypothetical protein Pmar_PMAR003942 [Perkinsus marinus ATCC 50983]EER07087.1 hypothetical protein Pmar_PMAR003942 [Perkinsus marinus ATCC 50983]|eukprot:XP_002775271.1 hypothetical protein Pmar_PMAR003942 [Perkinsus marinus ATCC 50983]
MQQEGERQSGKYQTKTVPQASTTKSMSHPADHAAGEGVNSRQLPPNAISPRRSLSRRGSSGPVALSAKDSLVLSADDESDATGHRKSSSTEANGTHVDDPEAESKAWAEYEARRERLERRRREREAREEQRRKNIEALNAASNYTYMDGTTQR